MDEVFGEEELLPLSALQHLLFCERQCALIHLEGQWADNRLTLEGSHLHASVDQQGRRSETRGGLRIGRGLALRSLRLGLTGRADLVEFHALEGIAEEGAGGGRGTRLPGGRGEWRPFPVEYKRGRAKKDLSDRVQLCAQALCLEEMLDCSVPAGALFYGEKRRRLDVTFDAELRAATEEATRDLHRLIRQGRTPRAVVEPKCRRCSLRALCLPEAMSAGRSARGYLRREVLGLQAEGADHGR